MILLITKICNSGLDTHTHAINPKNEDIYTHPIFEKKIYLVQDSKVNRELHFFKPNDNSRLFKVLVKWNS